MDASLDRFYQGVKLVAYGWPREMEDGSVWRDMFVTEHYDTRSMDPRILAQYDALEKHGVFHWSNRLRGEAMVLVGYGSDYRELPSDRRYVGMPDPGDD